MSFGVPLINADQVARDVVAPGEACLAAIAETFGDEILLSDGSLNLTRPACPRILPMRTRGANWKRLPILKSVVASETGWLPRKALMSSWNPLFCWKPASTNA